MLVPTMMIRDEGSLVGLIVCESRENISMIRRGTKAIIVMRVLLHIQTQLFSLHLS